MSYTLKFLLHLIIYFYLSYTYVLKEMVYNPCKQIIKSMKKCQTVKKTQLWPDFLIFEMVWT